MADLHQKPEFLEETKPAGWPKVSILEGNRSVVFLQRHKLLV
jgi:hypothetical protein